MNSNKNQIKIKFDLRERNDRYIEELNKFYEKNNEINVIKNLNSNSKLHLCKKEVECSICLQKIKINDIVRITSCKHQFHSNCIDRWLEEKPFCPLCKTNLLVSSS